jgi:branched-chain amino acid transport system permease protein
VSFENYLQVIVNGVIAGGIYVLVALGFTIIFQVSRFFDFSYAGSMTAGAYAAAYVSDLLGYSVGVMALSGVTVAVVAGLLFESFVYRPLRRRDSSSLVLVLSSLGLMIVTLNFVSLLAGDQPRKLRFSIVIESIILGSARITKLQLGILLVSLATIGLCWLVLKYTAWGKAVEAVSSDNELATSIGIRTSRIRMQVVALGFSLGGLAATLVAFDTGATPALGFRLLLPGLVAAIIGGVGSRGGALIGGMAIGIIEQSSGWFVSTAWQDAILFAILILFLLLRPQGILGKPLRRATV